MLIRSPITAFGQPARLPARVVPARSWRTWNGWMHDASAAADSVATCTPRSLLISRIRGVN